MIGFIPGLLTRSWRVLLGTSAVAVAYHYHAPWKPAAEQHEPCPSRIPVQKYLAAM